MSKDGNAFSKGGGGTNFEQNVQCAFLTTLILRGNVPCFPASEITELAFQSTSKGYQTDDIFVLVNSPTKTHRLLVQIKHNLTFTENDLFKEVISDFWIDFNNAALFDKLEDRLVIIKSGLNSSERNHIKTLLNLAKSKASEIDFLDEVKLIVAKTERLKIFRNILDEINKSPISDKTLWEFLKCLEVLEYDFLNPGSVDESNFLNLIKLTRRIDNSPNEKEIWDSILAYVSKLNKDAGTLTLQSVQKEQIYSYFDIKKLTPFYKSLEKLRSDSSIILKPFKNTIGGYHLNRSDLIESIIESIGSSQFTIITGKPGTGKSAIVKEVLESKFNNDNIFAFRADQFNESHLAGMFSHQGINESIIDLLSCIALLPDKIIFIDSLEKLLEGVTENAFKQFYILVKSYPNIKIVATTRKYAVDLLIQKFGIDSINSIEVTTLNEVEMDYLKTKIPQLTSLFNNKKIKIVLESPKYLDLVIYSLTKLSEDYSSISVTEFKKKLWSNIIEDVTTVKDGLARKRGKAFSNIALKRARRMKLFVEPDEGIDDGAIEALIKDDVIFKDGDDYFFAPSHDIFEDWALIKYIEDMKNVCENPQDIFEKIGNEPAIRRAFRLWVEDYLIDYNDKIIELVKLTLSNKTIDKYWADELLVAIFRSENCAYFFSAFETELLDNNAIFLNRCLLLIRTTCKENNNALNNNAEILMPIGSGWAESFKFIDAHISKIENLRLSILNFLFDWAYIILFTQNNDKENLKAVKNILLYYITQIENEDTFWSNDGVKKRIDELISLLYNIADVAQIEITELIQKGVNKKENNDHWRLNSFYDKLIKHALSGAHTGKLAQEIPTVVIETAWKIWKKEPRESSVSRFGIPHHIDRDEYWGIESHLDVFPSGVYKTPVYQLLNGNTFSGIKFIVEFLNYSVNTYYTTAHEYKKELQYVSITLNSGSTIKQLGNWELWVAYRGLSVTHYLLESILMGLEKFLLELASNKTEASRKILKYLFNYLLENSNSVAIPGVLSSIVLAYPNELGEDFLPLLTVKEFYEWDFHRAHQEFQALSPSDERIPYAQKERWKSNQLPHRTKYNQGICTFIVDFQARRTSLNTKIHLIFDKLHQSADKKDILWLKKLNEIDFRKWEMVKHDEKQNISIIQPKYEGEVKEFLSSIEPDKIAKDTSASYAVWLTDLLKEKGNEEPNFEKWEECYSYYNGLVNFDYVLDRPIILAIIGIRDFTDRLDSIQKQWCINQFHKAFISIIQSKFRFEDFSLPNVNLMDKDAVLYSIHILLNIVKEEKQREVYIELIVQMLLAPFEDHEISKIVKYVRNILFKSHPDIITRVWYAIIHFSHYRKANPLPMRFYGSSDDINTANNKEKEFIREVLLKPNFTINVVEISFDTHTPDILLMAFLISPYTEENSDYQFYIDKFLSILLKDLELEIDYSHSRVRKGRQVDSMALISIRKYLAELILNGKAEVYKKVIDLLYHAALNLPTLQSSQIRDIYGFINGTFEYTIYVLEEDYIHKKVEGIESIIANFWLAWEYLYSKEMGSQRKFFSNILLLDTEYSWNEKYHHWLPLENKKDFYYKLVFSIGHRSIKSIISIFSTIGELTFLPHGISLIGDLIKKNPEEKIHLVSASGERLIKRVFHNHMLIVKNESKLLADYLFILNEMIDMGSSQAYLIRENVITYKNRVNN
jgi:hypothetical protein